ncbi:hypothetical protein ACFYZ9_38510 [Streptomyces sp. NPDC001691]|uniref:hypothetical protein n=1 Tax=Streptomyces sp. NPDC001691 TaxID=3364600 RepID=UPI0036C6C02A
MTSPQHAGRIFRLVDRAAALPDVKAEVEANHDNNRWWPTTITDYRMRMLAAGWSTRVSYRMIHTFAATITAADHLGFDELAASSDSELAPLIAPLGLPTSRLLYLRSLADLTRRWAKDDFDPTAPGVAADALIQSLAQEVRGASFKVAQCAALYARGYHCGIIPVDSGMVTRLAPALGIELASGPGAHEQLRHALEAAVRCRPHDFRALATRHGHGVKIPDSTAPTWWTHLTLVYFKRLYLNGPSPRLCRRRPLCADPVDCAHTQP